MKLGRKGEEWIDGLVTHYTDGSSMCTTWEQEFFKSFAHRVSMYGTDTIVSVKQIWHLNKIADSLGWSPLELRDLDQD